MAADETRTGDDNRLGDADRARLIDQVLDTMPSAIATCRLPDTSPPGDLLFLDVNAAFERLAGVGRDQIVGRRAREVFAESAWLDLFADLSSGSSTRGLEHYVSHTGQWLRVAISPLSTDHVVLRVQDISEQKATERAVSERDERYRHLAEDAQDTVWWTDADGTILYVNPAVEEILGIPPSQAVGMPLPDYMARESIDEVRTWVRKALRADPPRDHVRGEVEYLHRDGRRVPGEINATLLRNDDGKVVAINGITRDVSERRMLEAQLVQAQTMEAISALAGGVAHDFSNLLSVVLSHVGFLLDDTSEAWPGRSDIEAIHEAARRAEVLTQQLVTLGRRQFQALEVLDPQEVIGELDKLLQRVIGKQIELVSTLHRDTWHIKADRGQLEQIIMNLVVNARDAMPAGGRLTIETSNVELDEEYARTHVGAQPGPHVRIAVSDTGPGMDPQTHTKIFEPFFTAKGMLNGTGLGLSTVYTIIKQSHGHIWVDTEPGRGSTFEVFLPRVPARTTVASTGT